MLMQDEDRDLSVKEAAYEMKLSPQTVYRMIYEGDLPYRQAGRRRAIRITREALNRVFRERCQKAG